MVGLMPQGAPQQGGPMMQPGGPVPPGGGQAAPGAEPMQEGPGGRRASEEEKALFGEFYGNVVNAAYQEKTADMVAEGLHRAAQTEGAPPPVEMLANVVSGAIGRVAFDGVDNGLAITREMVAAATMTLAADVGQNMAEAAGVPPLPEDQIHAVYLRSMEMLADQRDQKDRVNGMARNTPEEQAQEPQQGQGLMNGGGGRPPNRRERRAQASQERTR